MKLFTVAVIGCGSRGFCYGNYMFKKKKNEFKIVAACDILLEKLQRAEKDWALDKNSLFLDEEEFFKEKRADVLIIATQDRDHVRQCIRALALGYDVLLEKPISPFKDELEKLLDAQEKYGKKVVVCHVLRYAPGFVKVKEVLDSGAIGRLIRIEGIEQVAYWHQAHSFVRGNWRNEQDTSAMIMQKCCHDLDLLQYYAGAKCKSVYSVGGLAFFNRENQPVGAADRCADCKLINECAYSAENVYVGRWKEMGKPEFRWPFNVVDSTYPNTEVGIRKAYSENQYGRCVFACDNNVVDNQAVMMSFENGVECTLTMTGFTKEAGRRIVFHGTYGEIELLDDVVKIKISVYGKDTVTIDIKELVDITDEFSHGGGDDKLIDSFYDVLTDTVKAETGLVQSVESHLIALAAEESRKSGEVIKLHK